ncbi:MAG: ATP-binding protein [Euryarchaeota archaeon]|nr:ATP-binding protein [Euryarchaeota archaeon]
MDERELIEILNPFNFWRATPFTGITRPKYLNELHRLTSTGQVIVVTGVRRSGKTTILIQFLHHLIESKNVPASQTLYANLEDPRLPVNDGPTLLDDLMTAHQAFVDSEGLHYLILDEVQRLPDWERWVRIQQEMNPGLHIIVSGSSAELLSKELATLLTGRHLDLEVFPLDFSEYLRFHGIDPDDPLADAGRIKSLSSEYISASTFPAVVLTPEPDLKERMVQQIYRDIINHDVARRYEVREIEKLESVATTFVASVPGPVTLNGTRRALGNHVSLDSIERYSRYLEEPYLLFFLSTHSFSEGKKKRSPRKVYAVDSGILMTVSHRFSKDRGKLLENAVFLDLRRSGCEMYRLMDKKEVDFLIWKGTAPVALINVCLDVSNADTKKREVDGLRNGMRKFDMDSALVVTLNHSEMISVEEGVIEFLPYRKWALQKGRNQLD